MGRILPALLAALLAGFALLPIAMLLLASGLPQLSVRPSGIPWDSFSAWRGPRLSLLWAESNAGLLQSLLRTTLLALAASVTAASLSLVSAYLITRRRSRLFRQGVQALSLAAYGLPSVFLFLAVAPLLTGSPFPALTKVWIMHTLYILPMTLVLALGYAAAHPFLLDRSVAMDGARWPSRFTFAYRAKLWRAHLALISIGMLISWGDLVFSQQMLAADSKLLADLFDLRFFNNDSTFPDYPSAALFSLVLMLIATCLASVIALTNRRGA